MRFILFILSLTLVLSPCLAAKDTYNIAFIGNSTNAVTSALFNASKLVWDGVNASNTGAELKGVYVSDEAGSNPSEELKNIPNLTAVAGNFNGSHKALMSAFKTVPFISLSSEELVPEANEEYTLFRMCPGEIDQTMQPFPALAQPPDPSVRRGRRQGYQNGQGQEAQQHERVLRHIR